MSGRNNPKLVNRRLTQSITLACLLAMGAWGAIGPGGLLAWNENSRLLVERGKELSQLTIERDELRNRVALLDPRQVDPDMAGQLLRSNLNVVHPDEVVLITE